MERQAGTGEGRGSREQAGQFRSGYRQGSEKQRQGGMGGCQRGRRRVCGVGEGQRKTRMGKDQGRVGTPEGDGLPWHWYDLPCLVLPCPVVHCPALIGSTRLSPLALIWSALPCPALHCPSLQCTVLPCPVGHCPTL